MPTFQDLLDSLRDLKQHQQVRIQTIQEIERLTNRPCIVYAANTRRGGFNVPNTIDDSDITGFSDLLEGITGPSLDVVLHSPGGSAEATERIVNLLRERFASLRILVTNAAYSAATMFALAGDEIGMDDRSTLGPIDPQILLTTPQGITSAPVQDILDAFEKVRQVLKDEPEALGAYLPMLQKYDLHIFESCEKAQRLARTLAQSWLEEYMLRGYSDRKERSALIAKRLSDRGEYLSHGRPIGIRKAQELGLRIYDLRQNLPLREALWKLYVLIELFFDRTPAVKLFENSRGTSWARQFADQVVQIPLIPPAQPPQPSQERPAS